MPKRAIFDSSDSEDEAISRKGRKKRKVDDSSDDEYQMSDQEDGQLSADESKHVDTVPNASAASSRRRRRAAEDDDSDEEYREDENAGGNFEELDEYDENDDKDEDEDDDADAASSSSSEDDDDSGDDSDMFEDDDDYENLMKMNQLEREQILYERAEKKRKKQELKAAKKAQKKSKKTKKSQSLSSSKRKSDSQAKKDRDRRMREYADFSSDESAGEREVAPGYSSDEDYMEEKVERKSKKSSNAYIRPMFKEEEKRTPIDVETVRLCHIRRDGVAKIYREPYFEKYIYQKFVKVAVGKRHGQNVYLLGVVDGIGHHRSRYKFYDSFTDMTLQVRHGLSMRPCRLDLLSNSSITESEYSKWEKLVGNLAPVKDEWLHTQRIRREARKLDASEEAFMEWSRAEWARVSHVPSKEELNQQRIDAEQLRGSFVYTDDQLKLMRDQQRFRPVKNVANATLELIQLRGKIAMAEHSKDARLVAKLSQRLAEMERTRDRAVQRSSRVKTNSLAITAIWKKADRSQVDIAMREQQRRRRAEARADGGAEPDAFERVLTRPAVQRFGQKAQQEEMERLEKEIRKFSVKKERAGKSAKDVNKEVDMEEMLESPESSPRREEHRLERDVYWKFLMKVHQQIEVDFNKPPPEPIPQKSYKWYAEPKHPYEMVISLDDYTRDLEKNNMGR
eukprot:243093_1